MDTPLLRLSSEDFFTIRDACQGVCIFGGIGSGKTSGSGQFLAKAYLRAGMGGLVLCAKPEEAALWRHYVTVTGRSNSLIEFDGRQHGFNFISYELARQGVAGLNAVVECLMRVIEAARLASSGSGRGGDVFWDDTTRQVLRNSIPVLYAAYGAISIADIRNFVRTAPRSPAEMQDATWQDTSFMCASFMKAAPNLEPDVATAIGQFWRDEFATLDAKTRGNIVISLTTTLDRFNHGWLQHAFCGRTTVVPELCFQGAIILLNMPALTLNEDGIIAQQLFKYMWQRAVLARNALPAVFQQRPVFIWADEAQYFVNSYDAEFQSTCRGSRACTVYLSQSLPTYYAKMSGENSRERVHHLLGNFATKVFHNNACPETNEWAARTIGKRIQRRANYSETEGTNTSFSMNRGSNVNRGTNNSFGSNTDANGRTSSGGNYGSSSGTGENWGENRSHGTSSGTSHGYNEHMEYVFEPAEFGRMLRTGGPPNGNRVSAIWYQAGRRFNASHQNLLHTVFEQ